MSCYRPVTAFKPLGGGSILFAERGDCREISIPCGWCIGCRIDKREEWAIRCLLESQLHKVNSFVTLTYDEAHYPADGSLYYPDFQLFVRKLRRRGLRFRFFVAGEYGEELSRPHWHCLLFGCEFVDRVVCNSINAKQKVYTSALLAECWPHGFHSIGDVTYESCRYTAAYCMKKFVGPRAEDHYSRVDPSTGEIIRVAPEMCRMSLKPGIAFPWLQKFHSDIYETEYDAVIVKGQMKRVPRYFGDVLDKVLAGPEVDQLEFRRFQKAELRSGDRTAERLAVREQCELAKIAFFESKYNAGVI